MKSFFNERVNIFKEKHFGLGLRWAIDSWCWKYEFSLGLPFITITIGLGKKIGGYAHE